MLAIVARRCFTMRLGFLVVLLALVMGCEKSPTKPAADHTAPATITDLVVKEVADSSVTLDWTTPGDDGQKGRASSFDVRYSTSPITDLNFDSANKATGIPAPAARGVVQVMMVRGLTPTTAYYFAVKTLDEVPNASGLSNVVSATTIATPPDVTAPAAIASLATKDITSTSITVTWTATGDDGARGTASLYDLRYSTSTITEANWDAATQVLSEPLPTTAGTQQEMVITGLAPNTTYYFALKVSDEVPNVSNLSNVASNTTAVPSTSVYPTGGGPKSVALGDVNGDLKLDLVTANFSDGTVSVLLGMGNGAFSDKHDYPAGASPNFAVIGDLKADGIKDIVATNLNDNTASVLYGDGSGSFGAITTLPSGATPYCAAIGDFQSDGVPDIVTADNGDNRVSVDFGLAGGGFSTPFPYNTDQGPAYVAVGFLNGDAAQDLVTANQSANSVSVLLNSFGDFFIHTEYAVGAAPLCVAVGDLNGDGNRDLVAANSGSSTVSVLLGDGNGSFGAKQDFSTGNDPRSVAIGDLNGDGKPDLVTANYTAGSISVLLGNGDGTFGAKTDITTAVGSTSVAIADLEGDGKLDIVVANYGASTVSVLLNNAIGSAHLGAGATRSAARFRLPALQRPSGRAGSVRAHR